MWRGWGHLPPVAICRVCIEMLCRWMDDEEQCKVEFCEVLVYCLGGVGHSCQSSVLCQSRC